MKTVAVLNENNEVINLIMCEDSHPNNDCEIVLDDDKPLPIIGDKYVGNGLFKPSYTPSAEEMFANWVASLKDFMNCVASVTSHYTNNDEWLLLSGDQKQQLSAYRKGLREISNIVTQEDRTFTWPTVPSFLTEDEKNQILALCSGFDSNFIL